MLVNSKVLLEDAMKHNYAVAGINKIGRASCRERV